MNPEDKLLAAVSHGNLLLSGAVNPFEIDPLAFQHHPIRMTIGALCLVLALVLAIYTVTHRKVTDAKRKRKFGETVSHSTAAAASHKKKQRGERRYGEMLWTLFFPNYKGGGSRAGSADLNRASPASHRQSKGGEERYGAFRFMNPFNLYRGGGSKAKSAHLGQKHPDSYKERWGSEKRYGVFQFMNPFNLYRGGGSKAKSAHLGQKHPDSYKERWGSEKRYGVFRFMNPFNLYRGGSKAGEGRSHAMHQPESHTGRLFSLRGGWEADAPASSYKGGESRAEGAKLGFALPLSYRSRPGAQKKTYRFTADISSYDGSRASALEGKIPLPHVPTSHGGRRLRTSQLAGWRPFAAIERYTGSFAVAGEAIIQNLAPGGSHKRRLIPAVRYGFSPKELPAPSYKGGWAIAKPARLGRSAPQSHRNRAAWNRLGSKRWSIPVNSYKGGYGVAGVGKPVQELPLSYKEPWGFKARYFGFRGYRLLPIRLDGSPWPEFRHVGAELPLSYKEPWGSKLRYYGRKAFHLLPIHMDGAPFPDFRPVVELPPSYKEPWGSRKRFGRGFGWKWTIPGAGYKGGSALTTRLPWQNPDTGEIYIEHMSDKKRFGTSKYGGKLYGHRSPTYFKYHREEAPDDQVEWRLVRVGGVPVDRFGNKILPEKPEIVTAPIVTDAVEPEISTEPVVTADAVEEIAPEAVSEPVTEAENTTEETPILPDAEPSAPAESQGSRRRKRSRKKRRKNR